MAKRISEIVIEKYPQGIWTVWVDPAFDGQISKVEGVSWAHRGPGDSILNIHIDPRYDADEVEREIVELCR